MSDSTREPNAGQVAPDLPGLRVHVTGHNQSTGKAIIQDSQPAQWRTYDENLMAFHVPYTTSQFPVSFDDDKDISQHKAVLSKGKLGLVNANGTVCRVVDFAPGYESIMHRTQSLDYGVILEGEAELIMDSGDVQLMKRGDVAVQRATMHSWRNPSKDKWARMLFVLQDSEEVRINGQVLGEDIGKGADDLTTR